MNIHPQFSELQFSATDSFPSVVEMPEDTQIDAFIHFFQENKDSIDRLLLDKGAILFRGLPIYTQESFQSLVDAISTRFLAYIDGNSPRTKLSGNVYTSTEYDPNKSITMHNELSYSGSWPSRIFFCCTQPAETGGETPLADCREVLKVMNADLVQEIETKGLLYIRNLHGGAGLGPSWQDTFETKEKAQLEAYCRKLGISFEWKANGGIKLMQPSQGIIAHPQTKEKVWFNQIDQFHPSHMGPAIYQALMGMYQSEENLPMYVSFGDGSKIGKEIVQEILNTMNQVSVARPWQKGDLIYLDNVLVAHGRRPFTGKRKVLVSMTA